MPHKTVLVSDEVSESLGPLAVTARRLRGGVQEGVLLVELVAGSTRVLILPDRGLGIWKIVSGDVELGWQSPVAGPVHPRFVPLAEPSSPQSTVPSSARTPTTPVCTKFTTCRTPPRVPTIGAA